MRLKNGSCWLGIIALFGDGEGKIGMGSRKWQRNLVLGVKRYRSCVERHVEALDLLGNDFHEVMRYDERTAGM